MVRSVVDSPGTASQILLEENVHCALVVDDQTEVATETWSSMNGPVLMVVVAGPCELNSLDKEPAQKLHLALEIVLRSLLEVVVVVAVRHLAGAEVGGTGGSIVVMGVLLPDCTLAVLLFGVVALFDCTFSLFVDCT